MVQVQETVSSGLDIVAYHDLGGRPGFKMGLHESGGRWFLYLGHLWHRGWSVLEVTDPSQPKLHRFIEGPANTWTVQMTVAAGLMITGLERLGGAVAGRSHLWGGDPDGEFAEGALFWKIDEDPTDPHQVGSFSTGGNGTHRNFYAGGRFAYLTANMTGFLGKILVVVDVEDPSRPTEVGRWWYPGQWVANGEQPRYDTHAYMHGPAYVTGDVAYVPYGRAGMVTLDVSDPSHPRRIGSFDIGDFGSLIGTHTTLPIPRRNLLLLTTEAILEEERDPLNLALVLEVDDLHQVKPLSMFPPPKPPRSLGIRDFQERGGKFGPHNMHMPHDGSPLADVTDTVWICYENAGLWLYDLSYPAQPEPKGYFIPGDPTERRGLLPVELATQSEDVLVDERGFIYLTDKNHGLYVLKES